MKQVTTFQEALLSMSFGKGESLALSAFAGNSRLVTASVNRRISVALTVFSRL